MKFLDILKHFENNVNNLFDSYKKNDNISLFLNELKSDFNKKIQESKILCSNFQSTIDKHNLLTEKIAEDFKEKLAGEKKVFLQKLDNLNEVRQEKMTILSNDFNSDLKEIEQAISKINHESRLLSNMIYHLNNAFLEKFSKNNAVLIKQIEKSDNYYYDVINTYLEKQELSIAAIHSNQSKIFYNSEHMSEEKNSSIIKKIEQLQAEIKEIANASSIKEAMSRKSIISESGFFNSSITTQNLDFEEKVQHLQSENRIIIEGTEKNIEIISKDSDSRRKKILSEYVSQLEEIDETFNQKFKEYIQFKESALKDFEEKVLNFENTINLHKNLNGLNNLKNDNQMELNVLYKQLNLLKAQHSKKLEGIENLRTFILNKRKFEKFKAEVNKNALLEIENLTKELQLNIFLEEISLYKSLLESDISLLKYERDSSFNNVSIDKEKLVLKHNIDIKTLQLTSDYKKYQLSNQIERLKIELDYFNEIHGLVINSGKRKSTLQINQQQHLAMLKSEKYKILRNHNHNNHINILRNQANENFLFENTLQEKTNNFDFKKTAAINFFHNKKEYLINLNTLMITKERLSSLPLIKSETIKYRQNLKVLQEKKTIKQLRVDQVFLISIYNFLSNLSYNFSYLLVDSTNTIKNYNPDYIKGAFYRQLCGFFESFHSRLTRTIENEWFIISKSYNDIEPSSLIYSIYSNKIIKYENKKQILLDKITTNKGLVKAKNRHLTHALNHKIDLELQITKLKEKISSIDNKEFIKGYKNEILKITNSLKSQKDIIKKLDTDAQKIFARLKKSKKALDVYSKHIPSMKHSLPSNKFFDYSIFINALKYISTFVVNLRHEHDLFFENVKESPLLLNPDKLTSFFKVFEVRFTAIIKKIKKEYILEFHKVTTTSAKNLPKEATQLREKWVKQIRKCNDDTKNQIEEFKEIRQDYKKHIDNLDIKHLRLLSFHKRNYIKAKYTLLKKDKQTKSQFFYNNIAIDENILYIEQKHAKDLENINIENKKLSNENFKKYSRKKRQLKNEDKVKTSQYLSNLRNIPKILSKEEKLTLQEFHYNGSLISKNLRNIEKSRRYLTINHKRKVGSLNKSYTKSIRKIKRQINYQIKHFT